MPLLRFAAIPTVLLLASLFAGALLDFAPHTDDGCRTEIHCLTCRSALGCQAVAASTAHTLASLHVGGTVAESEIVEPYPVRRAVCAPRGPPSAS